MKSYKFLSGLCLAIIPILSTAQAKNAVNSVRSVASDDPVLLDCKEFRIKYSRSSSILDGIQVGHNFYAEDVTNAETYPVYIGDLNSEGGTYLIENFRSSSEIKIVSSGPKSEQRVAVSKDGQKFTCEFRKTRK